MFFLLFCDLSFLEYLIIFSVIVADELKEQELFIWTHFFYVDIDTSGHVLYFI